MTSRYVQSIARESMRKPHEAIPAGVPPGFDWREGPVAHAGLAAPRGMQALTGWGHCFVAEGAAARTATIEVRDMATWVRVSVGWVPLQVGAVEGAVFRADFAGNEAHGGFFPGKTSDSIAIRAGEAAHWWPAEGRAHLPEMSALVVSFRARASHAHTLLAGGGADYWASLDAPWDRHITNPPVGTGRLRWVGTRWATYAMGLFAV